MSGRGGDCDGCCSQSECRSSCSCSCSEAVSSKRESKLSRMSKHGAGIDGRISCQGNNKKLIKKDKNGRYRLKYKDNASNQVYKIDAPNNGNIHNISNNSFVLIFT